MPEKKTQILEIELIDILVFIKKYLRTLILTAGVCGILGVSFSFLLKKTYKSTIILLPEYGMQSSSFSLLGSAMGGDGAEKLLPELYPSILQSSPFGVHLLKHPVTDQENVTYTSLVQYLQKDSTQNFLSAFFGREKPDSPSKPIPKLSQDIISRPPNEESLINMATSFIVAVADSKAGIITISAETNDPYVSAILVEEAKNYLQLYVEDYRTTKAKQKVELLKVKVSEAQERLNRSQFALNNYRDHNRNTFLNTARIEEQRLQSEYLLSESIYNNVVSKYEQARLSVKDEKPVFKVLEPAKVPYIKSGPKRLRMGLITSVIGLFLGIMYVLIIKERVQNKIFGPLS